MLDLLQPTRDDAIVLIGDLVNRGPDSQRVVQRAREIGAHALLGNHEWHLLSHRRQHKPVMLKDYDLVTLGTLDPGDWDYLERMTLTCYAPAYDTLFVHAGLLPDQPWQEQNVSVVTDVQVIDSQGMPRRRSDSPRSPHWSQLWKGPPFVVYGHTPRRNVRRTDSTLGIDTGCVHGGHLTAYVLPEGAIHQVRARHRYAPRKLKD